MSFGFSLSDFALCINLSNTVYRALRDAPGECEVFAQEVLHLEDLLRGLWDDIEDEIKDGDTFGLLTRRYPGLSEHGSRCLELLCADIVGEQALSLRNGPIPRQPHPIIPKNCNGSIFGDLYLEAKQRFSHAKFARKIPRLRMMVAGIVGKLTAETVLIMKDKQAKAIQSQYRVEDSQAKIIDKVTESNISSEHFQEQAMQSQCRIEDSQTKVIDKITDSHISSEQFQEQARLTASALQESQTRIEDQLQRILKAQTRHTDSIFSGSLDASSPEGRQTWMELGRLLREEGITPKVVSKNKNLLIQNIKKSLEEMATSVDTASFRTALEHQSLFTPARSHANAYLDTDYSISLLGSAPSLGATFPEHPVACSIQHSIHLELEDNIENGMKALVGGMTENKKSANFSQELDDEIGLMD